MRTVLRMAGLLSVLAGTAAACASGPAREDQEPGTLVTRRDLAQYPGEPLARVLERKVHGVVVTRTEGGALALHIRGATSLDGTHRFPLYILNGLPIVSSPDGAVPDVDPFHIESIRVLRGSETAVYGMDGANGVILITTKKAP